MDNSSIIALAGMFFVFGFPLLIWLVFRLLAHREHMEMIRRGQVPPESIHDPAANYAMRRGRYAYGYDPEYAASYQLRRGVSVAFVGLALVIGLSFIGYSSYDNGGILGHFTPGPWLLFGLIPMFVGIAQVITSLLSGGHFKAAPRPSGFGPPSYGEGVSQSRQESESPKRPPV